MTHNEATWDRALRVIVGLGVVSLVVVGPQTLWGLLGLMPLVTGLAGYCPLYQVVRLSTAPPAQKSERAASASSGSAAPGRDRMA